MQVGREGRMPFAVDDADGYSIVHQ
jgi:hypothetical protein